MMQAQREYKGLELVEDEHESQRGRKAGMSEFGGAQGVLLKRPTCALALCMKSNPTPNFTSSTNYRQQLCQLYKVVYLESRYDRDLLHHLVYARLLANQRPPSNRQKWRQ